MEAVIKTVKDLASTANEATLKTILVTLRDLAYSIESPDETMGRILFSHLQISGVRIGIDLKIFDLLAACEQSMSLGDLTNATGADAVLLGRLLRYLVSVGMIKETGQDIFAATNVTKTLSSSGNQAGVYHYFNTVGPMFQELPDFLARNGYRNITDGSKTVLQDTFKTDLPNFLWLPKSPQAYDNFNRYMAARRVGMPTWLSVYPVKQDTRGWDPEAPVYVDMGGGIGHQCAEFKARYPDVPGRVILQDLPHCIESAISTPGVENTVHDIFQPQLIHGAKFYYMRGVLHDFPDDKCCLILQNIMSAMGKDSVILIDEMVLPNRNAHFQATQVDLTMMCALASMERTAMQWETLLHCVGLRIERTYVYTPGSYESVLVATRMEDKIVSTL